MTLRYLLDTSTLSAAFLADPDERVVTRLDRDGHACAIAAPVLHELLYGYERLPRGKRRDVLQNYIERVIPKIACLPYDDVAAAWHARERARLVALGRTAPYVDGQIAAVAYVNGLIVVTSNVKHFTEFTELQVEDWRR